METGLIRGSGETKMFGQNESVSIPCEEHSTPLIFPARSFALMQNELTFSVSIAVIVNGYTGCPDVSAFGGEIFVRPNVQLVRLTIKIESISLSHGLLSRTLTCHLPRRELSFTI